MQNELKLARDTFLWSASLLKNTVEEYIDEKILELQEQLETNNSTNVLAIVDELLDWRAQQLKQISELHKERRRLTQEIKKKNNRLVHSEAKGVRGVITWIACGESSHKWAGFLQSFLSVEELFNQFYRYPIVIFHPFPLSSQAKSHLSGMSSAKVSFQKIELKEQDSQTPLSEKQINHQLKLFMLGEYFWHPVLQKYDYYWHLDTEATLIAEISYDIFEFMESNSLEYGYVNIKDDVNKFDHFGFVDTVNLFLQNNPYIFPKHLDNYFVNGAYNRKAYYTDFEVSSFGIWRSKEYRNFYRAVVSSEWFASTKSWSKSAVHSIATSLFLDTSAIAQLHDILYKHRLLY
eukprot:CAMPEP_0174270016 /NCGR_PEP_ID=MMETSP0439-20130205/43010_1 /TAXON_ID=0 /ORGANISM="Stereomyxa ramosa, Strain Chinc5" /LENGTH=347 /DNA_ID=CAMNT_0015359091 /DNA_START=360 /DNA_END=1403 /DNA_ORIENTATION=-